MVPWLCTKLCTAYADLRRARICHARIALLGARESGEGDRLNNSDGVPHASDKQIPRPL